MCHQFSYLSFQNLFKIETFPLPRRARFGWFLEHFGTFCQNFLVTLVISKTAFRGIFTKYFDGWKKCQFRQGLKKNNEYGRNLFLPCAYVCTYTKKSRFFSQFFWVQHSFKQNYPEETMAVVNTALLKIN
jgi:hypothetical protein